MDLEKIRPLDGHLDRQYPVRQPPHAVQLDRPADDLGEDRQPLLGAGGTGMARGEQGQVGLGLAVQGGRHVDEGLMVQQLGIVTVGEAGAAADTDRRRRRQGIGRQAVHQFHRRGLITKVGPHRPVQVRRHCLGIVPGRGGNRDLDLIQLGDGVEDALRQLQGGDGGIAQGGGGFPIELPAVVEEARRPDGRQHPRRQFDVVGMALQPHIDGRHRHDLTPRLPHRGDAGPGVKGRVADLWQFPAATGQEGRLDLRGPVDGPQDADGLAGLMEEARNGADAVLLTFEGGGHENSLDRGRRSVSVDGNLQGLGCIRVILDPWIPRPAMSPF